MSAAEAPGRGLAAYLLYPRPEAWAKAQVAPACFLLAANSTGDLGGWKRFVVLWLVPEFLLYAARYQWNDIRGAEADRLHAERRARSRLLAGQTALTARRNVRLSRAVAALRVLAALLIGAFCRLLCQVLVLGGAVFVIAGAAAGGGAQASLAAMVSSTRATASATGTRVFSPVTRRVTSTTPSARSRAPTLIRYGMPVSSASLNFTPGRSSLSSISASAPPASSPR